MSLRSPRYIDTHIHLDQYEPELAEQLIQSLGKGEAPIEQIVAVSMHLESCRQIERWSARYPDRILPAYGWHPEQALLPDEELERLLTWMEARRDQMIAIGEVGLPYYLRAEAEKQGARFDRQAYIERLTPFVQRAASWNLPIVLHAVYDDAAIVCDLLEQYHVKRAHFHWFKGDAKTAARMAQNGYYISFTPDIVYEHEIQELACVYPIHQVMTETDGPWPFEGPFTGRVTQPEMVRDVARTWAKLRGIAEREAAQLLWDNAHRLYLTHNEKGKHLS